MSPRKSGRRSGAAAGSAAAAEPCIAPEAGAAAAALWIPAIVSNITSHLSDNEAACLRLVNKATAAQLRDRSTLHLSQPVPHWAFAERWAAPRSCRSLTRAQRLLLVNLTACSNDAANLEVALAAADVSPGDVDWRRITRAGALESLKWLYAAHFSLGGFKWELVFNAAGRAGDREVCEWCMATCPQMRSTWQIWLAAVRAVAGGHLELTEHLIATSKEEERMAMAAAAAVRAAAAKARTRGKRGRHAHDDEDDDDEEDEDEDEDHYSDFGDEQQGGQYLWRNTALCALEGCDLATVQQLCKKYGGPERWEQAVTECPIVREAMAYALRSKTPDWREKCEWVSAECGVEHEGNVETGGYSWVASVHTGPTVVERFEWLRSKGYRYPVTFLTTQPLAQSGNVQAIEWLIKNRLLSNASELRYTARAAAKAGQLPTLQALLKATPPIPAEIVKEAAAGGQLAVLQWALDAWGLGLLSPELFTAAALSGNVEMLRWLRAPERECPMAADAWPAAVTSGCEEAVEVLAEMQCPMPTDGKPYVQAMQDREWRMPPLLRRLGVEWGPPSCGLFRQAIWKVPPVPLLQWLVAEGCPGLDWEQAEAEAEREMRYGRTNAKNAVLAWIQAQRRQQKRQQRKREREAEAEAAGEPGGRGAGKGRGGRGKGRGRGK